MRKLNQQEIDHLGKLTRNEPLVREYPTAFERNVKQWDILPVMRIDLHNLEVSFSWLCWAFYYTWE